MRHLPLLAAASLLTLSAFVAIRSAAASAIQADAAAFETRTGVGQFDATSELSHPVEASFRHAGALSSGTAHGFAVASFGVLSALATATASTLIEDPAQRLNDPNPVFARGF